MPKPLDVRGEICPYPMMKAVEAIKKLQPDETMLEVLTDHAPALTTIPWEAAKLGYEADIAEERASEWRITLQPVAGPAKKPNEILADLNKKLAALSLPE